MESSIARRTAGTLVLLLAGVLAGCDDAPTDPDRVAADARSAPEARADTREGPGNARIFRAELRPLNGEVSHRPVRGQALIRIQDGEFTVRVNARGLEPGIPHPQHIHGRAGLAEGSCPDRTADDNGDGLIDVVEGVPDYGAIRLTLDGDLTDGPGTQVESLPNPDNQGGTVTYEARAPLSEVTEGVDEAFDGYDLAPEKRHIVLHGVDPDTDLGTAQSLGGLPAWLTLPVACGELERVGG